MHTVALRAVSTRLASCGIRQFHATAVRQPSSRITSSLIIKSYAAPPHLYTFPSPLFRRHFWGLRKQTSDQVAQAGKSAWKISVRFVLYSGAFIAIAIGGFFIYDVPFSPRSLGLS
jgi:hypothetical protein